MVNHMAHDTLRDTALVRAITDLLTDLSDLVQKELRLARAELTYKLTVRLQASIWFAIAGLLALVAALLIAEGVVLALASAGLALHWSCFLVAGLLAATAALSFYYGRAGSAEDLSPTRSARQFNKAVNAAREQLR
jgi:Putative Actinobacterial Holin-X, holin superfamily III